MVRRLRSLVAIAVLVLVSGIVCEARAQTTGTVRIRVAKAGFILGVGGGTGVLVFRSQSYPFRVGGVSAGTIGVAEADLVGTARNLRQPSDIEGTYAAASASVAVAGGVKTARLRNARGVILDLRGQQVGFEASLNLGGIDLALQR